MTHTMNGKVVTTKELINYVIASVVEDVQNNFDTYAGVCIKDFNELNAQDHAAIDKWKARVFQKVNTCLGKRNMVENNG